MTDPLHTLYEMIEAEDNPTTMGRLRAAADEIERLRAVNAAWMNGVADAVEPLGYDREAACGPADLLPGLHDLLALPPGTHRVTVHDDGTIEVVRLEREDKGHRDGCWEVLDGGACSCDYHFRRDAWVDVPAEPEDGAR